MGDTVLMLSRKYHKTFCSHISFSDSFYVEEVFSLGGAMKSPAALVTMCAKQNVFVLPNALF